MENQKCKYCGEELDKAKIIRNENVCSKCRQKLPLVKELVAICKEIKKECGKE